MCENFEVYVLLKISRFISRYIRIRFTEHSSNCSTREMAKNVGKNAFAALRVEDDSDHEFQTVVRSRFKM